MELFFALSNTHDSLLLRVVFRSGFYAGHVEIETRKSPRISSRLSLSLILVQFCDGELCRVKEGTLVSTVLFLFFSSSSFGDKYLNCERIGILNGLHPTTCSGQLYFTLKDVDRDEQSSRATVVRLGKYSCTYQACFAQSENPLEISPTSCNPPNMSSHGIVKRLVTVVKLNVKSARESFKLAWERRIEWNLSEQ